MEFWRVTSANRLNEILGASLLMFFLCVLYLAGRRLAKALRSVKAEAGPECPASA